MLKKKINFKSIMVLALSVVMSMGMTTQVMANNDTNLDMGNVVSAEEAKMIEAKMSEKNLLRHRIRMLQEENIDADANNNAVEISELEAEIEALDKEIETLGAVTPSDEVLEEIMSTDCIATFSNARSIWHPLEAIELFGEAYDIRGYLAFDDDLQKQYHLLFEYNGNDPYLFREIHGALEGDIPSEDVFLDMTEKVLNTYVGKLAGAAIDKYIRVAQILPWELLLEEKPNLYKVLRGSDILTCEASIYTMIKFVYVYDEADDAWKCTLSTNKVDYAYTLIIPVFEDGEASQTRVGVDGLVARGEMGNAIEDASWAFNNNTTLNTCMDTFAMEYKDEEKGLEGELFSVDLHTPDNLAGMYFYTKR